MEKVNVREDNLIELPSIFLEAPYGRRLPAKDNAVERFQEHYIKNILKKLEEVHESNAILHLEMVGRVSELLCRKINKPFSEVKEISLYARLHDIGKIGVPKNVLNKKGKLTSTEFQAIKTHTDIGYSLIKNLEVSKMGLDIIKFHHEKWDGRGYYGLTGEEIPQAARIVAVADVYDALRRKRSYKNAMSHEEAMEIILKDSGTHFDPQLVEVLLENEGEVKNLYMR